ncbi:MAG: acyl-CoA dehydrogenase [Bacteroidetes bacterium QH_8_67_23]|nr:MAG: acyl-CoA dehydrogenase [Bacteroidetes bacterium QH_8_67_23]
MPETLPDRFEQEAPQLGNQYTSDRVLRGYLKRAFGGSVPKAVAEELDWMGRAAGGRLYQMQLRDREHEPRLTRWDAWGERVDRIEVTDLWREARRIAAERGVVATAYEGAPEDGEHPRVHQFALAYLFIPSTDVYGCPLAMTDGAARTLQASGNDALIERAVPRLTSRDPERFWTSGQWMTELAGGSDVSRSRTTARQDAGGTWRLYGRKWFTSAIDADMALALARPETNGGGATDGGGPLALFFVPIRNENGDLDDGLRVDRLKDKLGTRKLPTAELTLDGARAVPVSGLDRGTRAMRPMLNVTRTWNAVTAVALMRRGLALARDYARRREVFGQPLADQPLHADTLAGLQSTFEAAFHLAFRVVELLGKKEAGTLSGEGRALLMLLTPLAKLTTARQAMDVMPEVLEAFGGAGYVEDTGLPVLERDAQVLPIWEGTTNVLALDLLRTLRDADSNSDGSALAPIEAELRRCAEAVEAPALAETVGQAQTALERAAAWLGEARGEGRAAVEAGARRFALTLGRALEAALLARHAQGALDADDDTRPRAAARRFAAAGLDRTTDVLRAESRALAVGAES